MNLKVKNGSYLKQGRHLFHGLDDCFTLDDAVVYGNMFIAGSLESANLSILATRNLFKEVVGKKSGFYVNEIFKSQ